MLYVKVPHLAMAYSASLLRSSSIRRSVTPVLLCSSPAAGRSCPDSYAPLAGGCSGFKHTASVQGVPEEEAVAAAEAALGAGEDEAEGEGGVGLVGCKPVLPSATLVTGGPAEAAST